ncbi:MAG: tRNA (adenosine(37)-N6)-threonylcarbamoyltransferase complex ATPase subunit type 1 TsaE [Oscillospiraceae bacterium]|nr:tRNA (adenosine(37)-N6)-threonylcarbamoyltransferase complex ATPase subunit type 1 TsaE [Oscillospiraceae bacterium]
MRKLRKLTTYSVDDTIIAGKELAETLQKDSVVLLQGEMGAGKTHFVKGIAQGLGITDTITSPTFALVNDFGGLIHFDLFRIRTDDDLYAIGFYDYIGKGVIAIEWAENIPGIEGEFDRYYAVKIDKTAENERVIAIDYFGA